MSMYSRRTVDDAHRDARGRTENREQPSNDIRKTRWSGEPSRYKVIDDKKLDTIITGHLTQEQVDSYQQYFRIEEISDVIRVAQLLQKDIISLLPSGTMSNYKRDPSPPPKYDNMGNRTNTREERTKVMLEKERHYLVELASSNIKDFMPPLDYRKPTKTSEKLYIPVKDYPDINFVGLLLGPRGNTLRQLQEESGARLAIRGKGSVKDGKSASSNADDDMSGDISSSFSNPNLGSSSDDLHVVITSDSQLRIAKAIKLTNIVIEKAISSPVGQNDLKRDQLRELAVLNGTLRETRPYNPEAYQKRTPRQGLDVSQIVCNACGKVGHFARDCKFNNRGSSGSNWQNYNDRGNSFNPNQPNISQENTTTEHTNVGMEREREKEREEILPPWKKRKTEAELPPWQKPNMPQAPSGIAPPPPMKLAPPNMSNLEPPSSLHPPPPPSVKVPPPPSSTSIKPPPPPTPAKLPPPPPPAGGIPPPPPTSAKPPPPPSSAKPPPPPPTSS